MRGTAAAAIAAALAQTAGCSGGGGGAPCAPGGSAPLRIDEPTTLLAACSPYVAENRVEVRSELTIEAGVTLRFRPRGRPPQSQDASLWVPGVRGARIVARGGIEVDKRIVFESADTAPRAGDWGGVVLDAGGDATSVFDYVTVRHAGGPNPETPAALWVGGATEVRHCTFEATSPLAVHVQDAFGSAPTRLVDFSGNTVANSVTPASVRVPARLVPTLGANNTFGGRAILVESTADVAATGSWANRNVFYELLTPLWVHSGVLTLESGVALIVRPAQGIRVGAGGTLVATGARITGTSQSAQSWEGINVGAGGAVDLTNTEVSFGGKAGTQPGQPLANIMFYRPGPSSIKNSRFIGGCTAATCPSSCTAGCSGAAGACGNPTCPAGCTGGCPSDISGMSMECGDDANVLRSGNTYSGFPRCSGAWQYNCTSPISRCVP